MSSDSKSSRRRRSRSRSRERRRSRSRSRERSGHSRSSSSRHHRSRSRSPRHSSKSDPKPVIAPVAPPIITAGMSADMISSTMANAVAKAQAAAAARAATISAAVLGTSASLSTSVAPPAPVSVAPTPASAPVTNVSLASALAKAQSVAQSALGAAAVASNITASLKPTLEEDIIPASNAPELDANGDLMSGFDGTLLIDAEMMKLNNVMRERAQRAKEYQDQRRVREAEQEQERTRMAAMVKLAPFSAAAAAMVGSLASEQLDVEQDMDFDVVSGASKVRGSRSAVLSRVRQRLQNVDAPLASVADKAAAQLAAQSAAAEKATVAAQKMFQVEAEPVEQLEDLADDTPRTDMVGDAMQADEDELDRELAALEAEAAMLRAAFGNNEMSDVHIESTQANSPFSLPSGSQSPAVSAFPPTFDKHSAAAVRAAHAEPQMDAEEEDPLDAFMKEIDNLGSEPVASPAPASLPLLTPPVVPTFTSTSATVTSTTFTPVTVPAPAVIKPVAVKSKEMLDEDNMEGFFDTEGRVVSGGPSWADTTALALDKNKLRKLMEPVDHSKIVYEALRKDFYVEAPDIARMTDDEVASYRATELEGVKLRGKNCPRPIKKWTQCGLPEKVYEVLKRSGFEKPFPIQAQAMPAIMSGRDLIGCAKTGSGKTLAFVLPMLRHIMDQRPLEATEGPIGLLLTPTRELALQIHREVKPFASALRIRCACVYGGGSIADQIADLKRGAEAVVATPGRLIDMLCANNGKVLNLSRVSYLVLDEADRMFDMGFEPQINVVLNNTRPDRQSVMFSATFPPSIEKLARKTLRHRPLEIVVGGRSVVSSLVHQVVEVQHSPEAKFLRLLQLLGEFADAGQALVFVDSQHTCDALYMQLLEVGYNAIVLHGAMDQTDRAGALEDFSNGVSQVLIATSIAARGLDVKTLRLVVNYSAPNHYEDYVHRCGRTGRAGVPGTAVTFITQEEDKFAPELVKALTHSSQPVPPELASLAQEFQKKRAEGKVKYGAASGFGGKSFGFAGEERMVVAETKRAQRAELGFEEDAPPVETLEDEDFDFVSPGGAAAASTAADDDTIVQKRGFVGAAAKKTTSEPVVNESRAFMSVMEAAKTAAQAAMKAQPAPVVTPGIIAPPPDPSVQKLLAAEVRLAAHTAALAANVKTNLSAAEIERAVNEALRTDTKSRAHEAAARLQARLGMGPVGASGISVSGLGENDEPTFFSTEIEINDYPQNARWKVSNKFALEELMERFECSIFLKGIHIAQGRKVPADERKLYLIVEGATMMSVRNAKAEIKRILEEAALAYRPDNNGSRAPGKFDMGAATLRLT